MEEFGCPFTFAETRCGEQSLLQIIILSCCQQVEQREYRGLGRTFLDPMQQLHVNILWYRLRFRECETALACKTHTSGCCAQKIESLIATGLVSAMFVHKITIYRVRVINEVHHNITRQEL